MALPSAESVATRFERWAGRVIVFCAIGTVVCIGGLVYLQLRVSGQAQDGRDARARQCQVAPVSLKEQRRMLAEGWITPDEFKRYTRGAPTAAECTAVLARK